MPPKKNQRKSKKKTITKSNQHPSSSSSHNNITINPPPSFFQFHDDDLPFDSDDDLPFDFSDYYDYGNYDCQDYDDFTNPFDPSYDIASIIKEVVENKPPFALKVMVEDLDVFVRDGGSRASDALLKLPLDIFMDIITRISIQPLAVCRCVCKTWLTIIHHPRFTKTHHAKATQQLCNSTTSLLFHMSLSHLDELKASGNSKEGCSEVLLVEYDNDSGIEKGVFVNPLFMPPKVDLNRPDLENFEVVGSCNGLLCLAQPYYNDPIYICNPIIGEYMTLPKSWENRQFEIISGFGYDEVANEYKVIRMISTSVPSNFNLVVEVYTLGSGKWRKVGKFPYPNGKRSSQVFVKGALHWMVGDYGESNSELITAFDMGREEFQVVPLPPDFTTNTLDCQSSELSIGELGGQLCLFAYSVDNQFEVWVMKDYGVKDSWTKEYIISRKVPGFSKMRFKPVTIMKNGNILLVINKQALVYYDSKRKRFRKVKHELPPRFDLITHVGSLISLKDFALPTNTSQHSINSGRWYGLMKSITDSYPEFDLEGLKLMEQLKRLWSENH
ncbi:hypothetical protein AQUCO_00201335v1 [Aquilegia coerulea]|uniref:F-box domain-containing protein n=1 Tax=Aquilegia coerulea TaxID=218851 RepID=A0A2G5F7H3_AQUCA|nr:hypothetical protein AQUCO_00201335v1 [Aquilegia coerulea]